MGPESVLADALVPTGERGTGMTRFAIRSCSFASEAGAVTSDTCASGLRTGRAVGTTGASVLARSLWNCRLVLYVVTEPQPTLQKFPHESSIIVGIKGFCDVNFVGILRSHVSGSAVSSLLTLDLLIIEAGQTSPDRQV